MLRSIKKLFGVSLVRPDGENGHDRSPVFDPAAFGIREHDPQMFS